MAVGVSCTIGKDKEKYYFYKGRRISEEAARTLRKGKKTRVAKCKKPKKTAPAAKKPAGAAKTAKATARRIGTAKAKAKAKTAKKRVSAAKRRGSNGEELVFIEVPAEFRALGKQRSAPKGRSRTTSDLTIFENPPRRRSGSIKDLIVFEEIPAKRRSSAGRGLPRPDLGAPPAPPSRGSQRAPQLLPLPVGAPTFLPPPPLPPRSTRRVVSAPARRTPTAKQRESQRVNERAAVWQLELFGEDINEKKIFIPNRRVDAIDRKNLLTPSFRKSLYSIHRARPGTLVWVDKKTDDMLREINRDVKDWELRAWTIYSQKDIMNKLNVIRP